MAVYWVIIGFLLLFLIVAAVSLWWAVKKADHWLTHYNHAVQVCVDADRKTAELRADLNMANERIASFSTSLDAETELRQATEAALMESLTTRAVMTHVQHGFDPMLAVNPLFIYREWFSTPHSGRFFVDKQVPYGGLIHHIDASLHNGSQFMVTPVKAHQENA